MPRRPAGRPRARHAGRRRTWGGLTVRRLVGLTSVCALPLAGPAHAEDTDRFRVYGGFRFGVSTRLTLEPVPGLRVDRHQQGYGGSLGVNLGRHLGLEVAADQAQTDLAIPGRGRVGEYGTFSLVPLARLRYPLLDGRLTLYALAGVGAGLAQFGDRKPQGAGLAIEASDWSVVGMVGGGVEYFVADNVAVGVEVKYKISRGHEIAIEGERHAANLDVLFMTAALRVLFPGGEAQPAPPLPDASGRFYIGLRYGGALTVSDDIGGELEARPGLDAIGPLDQLFAVGLGWDFGRWLGVELTGGGFSPALAIDGVGTVAEYALFYAAPQLRVRYPLLGGRLVPYAMAGVGLSILEVKDKKPRGFALDIDARQFAPAGLVGAGVDFMVARNIALGVEVEYLVARGHRITVDGRGHEVRLDAVLITGGLRVFFP